MTAPNTLETLPNGTIREPAAPTPAAPAAPVGPAKSAVEIATDAARARVQAGAPIVPASDPRPGDVVREPGQPRQPAPAAPPVAGQPAPAAVPPVAGAPAPVVPPVAPVAAEEVVETPEQKTAREAAEAVAAERQRRLDAGETLEIPADETPEQKTAREAAERTVTLVGRNNEEFVLELPDGTPKEVVDVVRQYRNGFMRGEEVRQATEELSQRESSLSAKLDEFELDPVAHLMAIAAEEPSVRLKDGREINLLEHTVLALMTEPALFARLQPKIEAMLGDEKELRTVRAESEAARLALREEMREVAGQRKEVAENLRDVRATVMAIVPSTANEQQAQLIYRDCMRDLQEYAIRNKFRTIPPKDIPAILATRLTAHGINPVEAATRAAESASRRTTGPKRAAAPAAAAPGVPVARPAAAPGGQKFVASVQKKATVAAIPPGGAGSPGAQPLTPPKNADGTPMSIEQRSQWHRDRVAAGQGFYKKT